MKLAARLVWLLLLAVPTTGADKFRQLEEILPTPNGTRAASGAPAPGYWQQTADYVIHVELDDDTQRIAGRETIHYTNHSPDRLTYLWLQLDNNIFNPESTAVLSEVAPEFSEEGLSFDMLGRLALDAEFDGSIKIESVEAAGGDPLPHTVVGTMMRIDLAAPLGSGESIDLDTALDTHGLRVLRERRQLRLCHRSLVPADGELYRRARLAPQTVPWRG